MEDIKNFFNILFFITIGIIAVLSYLQARKTLFSPIKTEIFKIQIQEFQSVLGFFNKQTSADFDNEFDIHEIFNINAFGMHHAYVKNFFDDELKPKEEFLKELRSSTFGVITTEKYMTEITAGSELVKQEKDDKELNPTMRLAKWKEYEMSGIAYTKKYNDKMEELSKLAASPLLPKDLTNKLYEFSRLMTSNLICMREVLTECSHDLISKYQTVEDNRKFDSNWMWNNFNSKRDSTDSISFEILEFINEHLKINEIMK